MRISDWPDLARRVIYWDDNHHLDKLDTLKAAILNAAYFKATGFAIKLNGHFQFQTVPAAVEPYALSAQELQELTSYGLRHHVEVIPYLDAPGHISWLLKHPEYKGLRSYPQSNFHMCTTSPDAVEMYRKLAGELIAANQGVKNFILSTDEAYYVGLANTSQCDSAKRTTALGN